MSDNIKKAIIGTHHLSIETGVENYLKACNYSVQKESDPTSFINSCLTKSYNLVLMDLNFGKPASNDVSIAVNTYKFLQKSYNHKFGFIGFSGMDSAVEDAKIQGVPAVDKIDLIDEINNYISKND